MDKNNHVIIGNLGDDPTHFSDPGKTEMATFSVATTLHFQGTNGQSGEETEWHRVVAFAWRASVANDFRKGERVYVEGYVRTRSYEKDGETRYVKEIVAQTLHRVHLQEKLDEHDESRTNSQKIPAPKRFPQADSHATSQEVRGALY